MANNPDSRKGEIIKEGYIVKQGRIVKNWKKRYFILKEYLLSYSAHYVSPQNFLKGKGEKGKIYVPDITNPHHCVPVSEVDDEWKGRELHICTHDRILKLRLKTIEDAQKWSEAIKMAYCWKDPAVQENRAKGVLSKHVNVFKPSSHTEASKQPSGGFSHVASGGNKDDSVSGRALLSTASTAVRSSKGPSSKINEMYQAACEDLRKNFTTGKAQSDLQQSVEEYENADDEPLGDDPVYLRLARNYARYLSYREYFKAKDVVRDTRELARQKITQQSDHYEIAKALVLEMRDEMHDSWCAFKYALEVEGVALKKHPLRHPKVSSQTPQKSQASHAPDSHSVMSSATLENVQISQMGDLLGKLGVDPETAQKVQMQLGQNTSGFEQAKMSGDHVITNQSSPQVFMNTTSTAISHSGDNTNLRDSSYEEGQEKFDSVLTQTLTQNKNLTPLQRKKLEAMQARLQNMTTTEKKTMTLSMQGNSHKFMTPEQREKVETMRQMKSSTREERRAVLHMKLGKLDDVQSKQQSQISSTQERQARLREKMERIKKKNQTRKTHNLSTMSDQDKAALVRESLEKVKDKLPPDMVNRMFANLDVAEHALSHSNEPNVTIPQQSFSVSKATPTTQEFSNVPEHHVESPTFQNQEQDSPPIQPIQTPKDSWTMETEESQNSSQIIPSSQSDSIPETQNSESADHFNSLLEQLEKAVFSSDKDNVIEKINSLPGFLSAQQALSVMKTQAFSSEKKDIILKLIPRLNPLEKDHCRALLLPELDMDFYRQEVEDELQKL